MLYQEKNQSRDVSCVSINVDSRFLTLLSKLDFRLLLTLRGWMVGSEK